MAKRIAVLVLASVLLIASVAFLMFSAPPLQPASSVPSAGTAKTAAVTPTITYNYSDFFNVPYGEWWDIRAPLYGDEPVNASCFNATSVADGTCTTNVPGLNPYSQYPYMDWAGSGNAQNEGSVTAMYAPYRTHVSGLSIPGYNLSEPVFLPVTNPSAAAGSTLSFNWYTQYLDKANFTLVTTTRGCYGGTGATANDGYQLWNQIHITLDNQEAARLFGATVSSSAGTIQSWWNTNTLPGCGHSKTQFGTLESNVDSWFADEGNRKYDIWSGYDFSYGNLYTNITAVVRSGGATGLTDVYIEHGAWGTEILLDRWFYWGNAWYAGNQSDSSKAQGWWGMENGWWEDVHYAGKLQATTMNFNLSGVLQYHFQEHSAPGPDGCLRQETGCTEATPSDDTPYWTWGPMLVDYVPSAPPKHLYSELDRFAGLNYIKTTPGSGDYGTNTSFDYTPVSWAAKSGETWNYVFPTGSAAFYQDPATAPLGTDPIKSGQLPTITSRLSLMQIFPAGYGTWNGSTGVWTVVGGSTENWPPSTGPGTYPYIPYPGIYLQPANIPPGVTTDPATGISSNAATLNGELTSLGSAYNATVGFLWGTSPSLAGATNVTYGSLSAPGPFSHGLTGLSLGVTYYFRAWAIGVKYAHGIIQSFNTEGTPPSVTTQLATGVGPTNATLNGDLAGLGTAGSVAVGFFWSTDPNVGNPTNVSAGTLTAAGPFVYALTGLTAGTKYYFRAWADGDGFALGTILNFTTATVQPAVVTDFASAVITTGANLNGHTTSLGSAPSVVVGFLWGTDPLLAGATNVTVTTQTVPGSFTEPISGLTPGTTYYYEAWANGTGFAVGGILSFTTGSAPPTVVTDQATSVTPTSATVNGHTTDLGSATSVAVGFLWGTSPTLAGATNVSAGTQTAPGPFVADLNTLSSGTTYYFQAWANGTGFATGTILNFTAALTPPSVTTNTTLAIGTTTATLNAVLENLGSSASVEVGFLWGTDSTLTTATNVSVATETAPTPFTHDLVGLVPGTRYYAQAWANGTGFGRGVIASFTTHVTPPAVVTDPATGIMTSNATLNGHTTSLGTATTVYVGFRVSTSPILASPTNVTDGGQNAPAAFSVDMPGLAAGTTYYFQAWALGDGFANGSIESFVTGTMPPIVQTNAASAIFVRGATLNGATTTLGTAGSVSVGFLWGTNNLLAGAANVSAGTQSAAGAFTHGLIGLSPSTTYYFQAWANGQGFGAGSIESFTTGAISAPTVTTTAASGVTSAAATLNGNLVGLGTASSVTVGFLWGTSSTLTNAANVTVGPESATGAFTHGLAGLTPGTTYYFAAWAFGDGFVQGTPQNFATPAAVSPPSVTSVDASEVTSGGATLNGNLAGLGSANSVSVGFLWGTDANLAGATNYTVGSRTAAGTFLYALTGLTAGTTYYFQAWANASGFVHGSILHFTTPAAPSEPTFLGLPALVGYGVVAAIIIVIVVALLVVLMMRRRKKTPPPETP